MKFFLLTTNKKEFPAILFIASVLIFFFLSKNLYSQTSSSANLSGFAQKELLTPGYPLDSMVGRSANQPKEVVTGSASSRIVVLAPSNDDCSTALNAANTLTPGSNCKGGTFLGATKQAGELIGSCIAAASTHTVWYSFTATQANMWVDVKADPASQGNLYCSPNFGIAVWQYNAANCPPTSGAAIGCKNFQAYTGGYGNYVYNVLNLSGLTPGATYLVQLVQKNSCNGLGVDNFCVAVGTPSSCTTCASNCGPMCITPGYNPSCWLSVPCSNALIGLVTSTCPSYPLGPPMNQNDIQTNCYSFTAVNDSMWLQQISYSYCNPNSYSFTYNLYNAGCGFMSSGNVFAASQGLITGLVIGTTYKICYTLQSACSWDSIIWPFAYTTSSALPVEFVSFGGMSLSEKIKLYWTTASEENCKEYIIEKTLNGMDFVKVAEVKGAGNSTSLLNYKAYDNAPLKGKNFYRIKQIDYNGNFTYSKLIAVNHSESASDISIIPNPANDIANITFNAAGSYPVLLKVIDMQGKVIVDKHFVSTEGVNEFLLDTKGTAKGIYSVQLVVDDQNMVTKLVKE